MKKSVLAAALLGGLSLAAFGASAGEKGGGKHWDRIDINGDGLVTQDELNERSAGLIEKADANGDGAVSKEEMTSYREARRAERRAERNPDKNDDGVVDRTEFIIAAQDRFDRLDTNSDGVLSEDEQPRRRGHRGGHRRGN